MIVLQSIRTVATRVAIAGLFVFLLFGFVPCESMASPRVYPTGVTIYDPARAYNSYIVVAPTGGRNVYLVDMNGNEVRHWNAGGWPVEVLDPKVTGGKLGHILGQIGAISPDKRGGIFIDQSVGELDWDGNKIWEWGSLAPSGSAWQNHDLQRLVNGNTLLLVAYPHVIVQLGAKEQADQAIYEVDPTGEIVWKWVIGDHLDEFGFSAEGMKYMREKLAHIDQENFGFLTINTMHAVGANRWFDAGDDRFAPENVLINSRTGGFMAIIGKKSGKVVWRLGPDFPDSQYNQDARIFKKNLPRQVDQLSGQHDPHLIAKGLPGAGNVLVFDNQSGAGFPVTTLGYRMGSRVLEINPVTKDIVWQYTGESSGRPAWTFFSSFMGSVQRLPNGNTLIDEAMNGRLFQVTPEGDIVWEYVSPYTVKVQVGGKIQIDRRLYRTQAVPYDWIPEGTPHAEMPVTETKIDDFRTSH